MFREVSEFQKPSDVTTKDSVPPVDMGAFTNNIDIRIVLFLRQVAQEDCATASVKEWAQRLRLSTSRFEHLLKQGTGISPSKYITLLRLQRAKDLLKTTSLSVKEIMCACGISHRRVFNRQFQKRFGKTPTEVRCDNLSRKRLNLAEKVS